jgi:AmmeMemoRadiSam system protein B/AmmeMemoRadiSam system protein A
VIPDRTRATAVAGRFYPAEAVTLARDVDRYLAEGVGLERNDPPKALVVPHAGYVYSGPIAGSAYRTLLAARGRVRRVVLLGPAHRVPVRGLARPSVTSFATPLGPIRIDERLDVLLPDVPTSDAAHAQEHALEVQLPFLVRALGMEITVAPLVVGDATPAEVASVIDRLWGGDETVIIVSSDLSHYLPYATAARIDGATADAIVALDPTIDPDRACGARAIAGLLVVARQRAMRATRIDLRSSGDTAGARDEVVGYGAFAFYEPEIDAERGRMLVRIARGAVDDALAGVATRDDASDHDPDWLRAPRGVFVTLHRSDGRLHGCIGEIEARRPLGAAVRRAARLAATEDPRADEIGPDVADDLAIEVSVLSPLTPIDVQTRADLIRALRPNEDGLVLAHRGRRATYLPQVWESLPDRERFVGELFRKAGLPRDFWDDEVEAYRYRATSFTEGT